MSGRERGSSGLVSSAPFFILFVHFVDNASAGHLSSKDRWLMTHPSSSDGDGARQQAWTKVQRALRQLAAERMVEEDVTRSSGQQELQFVDFLSTQVRANGAWKGNRC